MIDRVNMNSGGLVAFAQARFGPADCSIGLTRTRDTGEPRRLGLNPDGGSVRDI